MAGRGSNKSSSGRQTTRKTARKSTRKQQSAGFSLALRPEHQRELFALALITVALVTLVFFLTGTTGGVGSLYVQVMRQAFGAGALFVPLALGVLGGAILIQERLRDARLTGANIVGTGLILVTLLALLEFPAHALPLDERSDQGGGLAGYTLVNLLDSGIGRPAALVVVCVLGLTGIMLTFNITLGELFGGMAAGMRQLWQTAWSGPRRPADTPQRPAEVRQTGGEALPFMPPPGAGDDIVPTPIAARPTRASLFLRQPAQADTQPPQPAPAPAPAAPARPQPQREPAEQPAADQARETVQTALAGFEVPAIQRAWPLPAVEILEQYLAEGRMTDVEIRTISRQIEETLASFKVEAQVVNVNPGPAVTQFELQPALGVKVSKITSLEKDLALALAAQSIRIEAPIPGKAAVGIEIPNSAIAVVGLREVMDSPEFEQSKAKLKLTLGKDVSGNSVIADMARMPHLLVAGATGSGKSVAINAFLCGLLLKHTPDELKLIMVDPKMVELIVYNRIPHLLSPVVTELERVVPTLKWATREMERRYKVFARHGCRNLDSYKQLSRNRNDLEAMPYILIIIDELADLMMMAPDEVETQICRLAQMARATGIHLIIATQRPSVDVITGLIKANFPSRIAFAVTSQVDSRVILDTQGAEQLLGRGDMLYMAPDAAKLVRIQGTFVSDAEVEQIVAFWRNAQPPETPLDPPAAAGNTAASAPASSAGAPATATAASPGEAFTPPAEFLSSGEQDELLPQAMELVKQHRRASASLLQRRLRIGYSKAAQLIDLLEEQGVVGPAEGGRSREVLDTAADD